MTNTCLETHTYTHIKENIHGKNANTQSQDDTKVHVLVHHVRKFVRHSGVPLGPTSDQTLESQHTRFNIF